MSVFFRRRGKASVLDDIFANNSWEAIIAACQRGRIPDSWTVGNSNPGNPGWVEIDGTQVLQATSSSQKTYDWTVPSGISTIEIALNYKSWSYGRITVTTAKGGAE